MADKIRIELNSKGVQELLKSSGIAAACQSEAEKIRGRCGDGYATDVKTMGTRVVSSVYTETTDAMRDQLDNNTILKAMK